MNAREPIVSPRARPRGERRAARWPLAVVVLVVLAALAVVPFLLLRPGESASTISNYQTAAVSRGTLTQRVGGAGVVVPRVERAVLAGEAGVLASWAVAVGDEVDAGDVMALLRADGLDRELERARAALSAARRGVSELQLTHESEAALASAEIARLEKALVAAQAELELAEELFSVGAISRSELAAHRAEVEAATRASEAAVNREGRDVTRRRLALEGAEANVAAAEAEMAAVERRFAGLEVTAPVAGRVIEVRAAEGSAVAAGTVLAVVASTSDLSVRVDVREAQAGRVTVGQPVAVRVAGEVANGTVSAVAPQAHSGELGSMVAVAIDFDAAPPGLRLGGSVSAEIEVGRLDDVLYLPRGLFLSSGGERFAFVVDGAVARRRSVVFGMVDGDRVQVVDGLEEGEEVIVSSYDGFVDLTEARLERATAGAGAR